MCGFYWSQMTICFCRPSPKFPAVTRLSEHDKSLLSCTISYSHPETLVVYCMPLLGKPPYQAGAGAEVNAFIQNIFCPCCLSAFFADLFWPKGRLAAHHAPGPGSQAGAKQSRGGCYPALLRRLHQ